MVHLAASQVSEKDGRFSVSSQMLAIPPALRNPELVFPVHGEVRSASSSEEAGGRVPCLAGGTPPSVYFTLRLLFHS